MATAIPGETIEASLPAEIFSYTLKEPLGVARHHCVDRAARRHDRDRADLGELAASIAHEINQPLAAIVADANACLNWLATARPPLDQVREALAAVVNDGARAAEVLTRIRALLARSVVARRPCRLAGVIGDVLPLVRSELGRHGITLQMALAEDLPTVLGERIHVDLLPG